MNSPLIGMIGLGAMGEPIARNLLRSGFDLAVTWHKNQHVAHALARDGARVLHPVQELARQCEIVITMVPGDDELEEIYLGERGLLRTMAPTGCCMDLTTARPSTIRAIARAAGEQFDIVDAPVSGGVPKAREGTLTAMIGATEAALRRVTPILTAICGPCYHAGDVGSGKAMKMVNQLMVAGNTYLACEALALAQRVGLDLATAATVIPRSSGTSWAFETAIQRSIMTGDYTGGFPLRLMKKDLEIGADAAREAGLPLPLTEALAGIYRTGATPERLQQDFPVLYQWLQEQAEAERPKE